MVKRGTNEKSIEVAISEAPISIIARWRFRSVVLVNGEERAVTSVIADPLGDRLFILNLDRFLFLGDAITVSYSGTSILSQSSKTLNTFTDLPINNVCSRTGGYSCAHSSRRL